MIDDNKNDNIEQIKTEQNKSTPSSLRRKLIGYLIIFLFCICLFLIFVTLLLMNETHKPAIYLYSDKPTAVNIKLDNLLIRGITIPKYSNGWSVMTNNDGSITDLKPLKTDCAKLLNEFGFEYAQEACRTNLYPYIYWDGTVIGKLPQKTLGWSVKKENISDFLNEKADEIGMNKNEKTEFVRYWANIIQNYPANDFRIYFLQNEEVDNYIKLKVSPMPDSWNRMQIVITPISQNIKSEPYPLEKIERKGFTLVEWGGIINESYHNMSR